MKINAFCTSGASVALNHCDRVLYCGDDESDSDRITVYTPFREGIASKRIYIGSMSDSDVLAAACDYLLEVDGTAIVRAAYDMTESGIIEARYKLSPIMLLHKLSVLEKCIIVGGVCLDNDDMDLMAQQGVPLVVTPIASAGYGYGFAPVSAAVRRGVRVGLGTFDGKYNVTHELDREAEFMTLTSNAEMRDENSLERAAVDRILAFM